MRSQRRTHRGGKAAHRAKMEQEKRLRRNTIAAASAVAACLAMIVGVSFFVMPDIAVKNSNRRLCGL